MKNFAIAIVALGLLTSSAFAQTTKPTAAKPAATKVASAKIKCAVTGEEIASIKDSVGTSVYKNKTYYFCCAGCKPMFDKNPAKYAKADVKTPAKPAAKTTKKKA